jgi:hypothetical protein
MAHPGGRPTKLTEELLSYAHQYLGVIVNDEIVEAGYKKLGDVVPTIEGLAIYLGISRETAYAWEKTSEEFSYIMEGLRQLQGKILINGALANKFNPTISKLLLSSKHGYVEKSEQDITSKGESINQPDDTLRTEFANYLKSKKQGE